MSRRRHLALEIGCRAFVEQYDRLTGFPNLTAPYAGAYVAAKSALQLPKGPDPFKALREVELSLSVFIAHVEQVVAKEDWDEVQRLLEQVVGPVVDASCGIDEEF